MTLCCFVVYARLSNWKTESRSAIAMTLAMVLPWQAQRRRRDLDSIGFLVMIMGVQHVHEATHVTWQEENLEEDLATWLKVQPCQPFRCEMNFLYLYDLYMFVLEEIVLSIFNAIKGHMMKYGHVVRSSSLRPIVTSGIQPLVAEWWPP